LDSWFARVGQAQPFLKWAGGKQVFLQRHSSWFPSEIRGSYLEPFLGSGAVYFFLMRHQVRPFPARLGDTNKALVRTFMGVRDDPSQVHERLTVLQAGYSAAADKPAFFYELRDAYNSRLPTVDSATFIFLNRT
jgi:DNA adenine methylase